MQDYTHLPNTLPATWQQALANVWQQPAWLTLLKKLADAQQAGQTILPAKNRWLHALNSTPFEQVKVVILGQDPYPTIGHAHGLAFSVLPDVKPLPRSLQNINKELLADLAIDNQHSGYLQTWANQGILLLNATLTVEAGKAGAHQKWGWSVLTDAIIQSLSTQREHVVFVLWGRFAQQKAKLIDEQRHLVLRAAHPSPLSARRGFFGSRPFSQINDYLQQHHQTPIDWQIPKTS